MRRCCRLVAEGFTANAAKDRADAANAAEQMVQMLQKICWRQSEEHGRALKQRFS